MLLFRKQHWISENFLDKSAMPVCPTRQAYGIFGNLLAFFQPLIWLARKLFMPTAFDSVCFFSRKIFQPISARKRVIFPRYFSACVAFPNWLRNFFPQVDSALGVFGKYISTYFSSLASHISTVFLGLSRFSLLARIFLSISRLDFECFREIYFNLFQLACELYFHRISRLLSLFPTG